MALNITAPLTTADVPPQFLNTVFLTGHMHWTLQSDPRVSYAMYIPSSAPLNPDPASNASLLKLPLIVTMHGTRRNTSSIYAGLKTFADKVGAAVLAPLFPAGLDGPNDIDSYKVLSSGIEGGFRSDIALRDMLAEVAVRWPGVDTSKVYAMGFSGGGQFVQRFLYLYPERLAAASIGAPGEPTHLNSSLPWPKGIADVERLFNRSVSVSEIGKVPVQLVVGSEDNVVVGDEAFWTWFKSVGAGRSGLDRPRKGRLDALRELREEWAKMEIEARWKVVEGVGHESGGVESVVLGWMREVLKKAQ